MLNVLYYLIIYKMFIIFYPYRFLDQLLVNNLTCCKFTFISLQLSPFLFPILLQFSSIYFLRLGEFLLFFIHDSAQTQLSTLPSGSLTCFNLISCNFFSCFLCNTIVMFLTMLLLVSLLGLFRCIVSSLPSSISKNDRKLKTPHEQQFNLRGAAGVNVKCSVRDWKSIDAQSEIRKQQLKLILIGKRESFPRRKAPNHAIRMQEPTYSKWYKGKGVGSLYALPWKTKRGGKSSSILECLVYIHIIKEEIYRIVTSINLT